MHNIPANTAHPEPFYKVVLLFKIKIMAVATNEAIANTVTNQTTIFGRNRAISITNKLNPNDIKTPQSKKSMAL
jgi:hypothetical protein